MWDPQKDLKTGKTLQGTEDKKQPVVVLGVVPTTDPGTTDGVWGQETTGVWEGTVEWGQQ